MSNRRRYTLVSACALALGAAFALGSALAADTPSFTITSPASGATVSSPVAIVVDVQNAKIGRPTDGLDHLHVGVDGGPKKSIYAAGPVELNLAPGEHTVAVELAGPTHHPFGPAKTVTFTVK